MKRLSASSKIIGGIAVVGCAENEEEDASVDVVVCDSGTEFGTGCGECCYGRGCERIWVHLQVSVRV